MLDDDGQSAQGLRAGQVGERPFVLRGEERGFHGLSARGTSLGYSARLKVRGDLPLLFLQHRSTKEPPPEVYGPAVTVGEFAFDRHFEVRSESLSLPARLFSRPPLLETVGGVVSYLEHLELRPGPDGTALHVDVRVGGSQTRLDEAVRFTTASLEAADLAAAAGQRLDDARAAVADLGAKATPEERVEALVARVTRAAHWLTGHTDRVRDSVEARLVLADAGREHRAVLRLLWRDPSVTRLALVFEADLPWNRPALHLRPKPPGLLGLFSLLAHWGEQVVGDAPLDDTFIIRGEHAAGPVLLRARGRFLELGRRGAAIDVGDALTVRIASLPNETSVLVPAIEAVLEVWRCTARHGLGLE